VNAFVALNTAYDAWRETQPQLFWTDENLWGGLDEQDAGAFLLVEPAVPPVSPPHGGLDLQAFDGDGANPGKEARRPQKGA